MIFASRLISEGFALSTCPEKLLFQDDPLLTFRSPSEYGCTGAAAGQIALPATASLAVFSPSTSSRCRVATHLRRRPTSGYVPSQRFSRPQGFFPPGTCRPCFMPVPPMGFHPSGSISTRRAEHPLGRRCPPGVDVAYGCHPDRLGCLGYWVYPRLPWRSCRGDGASFDTPLFRALLPASVRFSGLIV